MTQLFIDGQEVVLPGKFTCKRVSENPFFTKSGDYTLNINLSLQNPINAKIYKHINRLQSLSRFENRTAIIVSDNIVVIKGKEVVLKYTNEQVEIQIVAGNSSLNYLIGNNLKIRDLNMGYAVINKANIVSDLNYSYPERNWQLLPFYDPDTNFIGNRYTYKKDVSGNFKLEYAYDGQPIIIKDFYITGSYLNEAEWFLTYVNYRPQPYLCFIIEKVMQALGYSLNNSLATHDIFKYAYIVHAQDTHYFAKMLPDWTVEKFFSEIEALFDCSIIVANEAMTANIVFNSSYYNNTSEHYLTALDDFEAEFEESDEKMIYNQNIGYNLPDTTYYKYQNIPDELFYPMQPGQVTGSTDQARITNLSKLICEMASSVADKQSNRRYLTANFSFLEYREEGRNTLLPIVVNDYKDIKNNTSDEIDTSFDIIPAEFEVKKYMIWERYAGANDKYMMYQFPIARCSNQVAFEIEASGVKRYPYIQEYIEGSSEIEAVEKTDSSYTQLSIAFYKGDKYGTKEGTALSYSFDPLPLSFVRGITERPSFPGNNFAYIFARNGEFVNPLSVKFLYDEFYSKNLKIDKSRIYRLRFWSDKMPDPKSLFIINNKIFYCIKIESTITIDGTNEIYEGEFYGESV